MLDRADLLKLIDDVTSRAADLRALASDAGHDLPPIVAATAAVKLASVGAKLARLAGDVRRAAEPPRPRPEP